nr:hypothetical protein [Nitrosopumilus sp.]
FNVLPEDGNSVVYQWAFPGGIPASSTSLNPSVNYPFVGAYIATLVIANGHQTDTTKIAITATLAACSTSFNEEIHSVSITISPSPVSSTAMITINGIDLHKDIRFQLYNYLGQEVGAPVSVHDNVFMVNVEGVASGGYFFNITQDKSVVKTEKFFILNR